MMPIQSGNEIICPCGCGVVLQVNYDDMEQNESTKKPFTDPNLYLLGSAVDVINRKIPFKNPNEVYEERILRKLESIIKELDLPQRFIIETFNNMKKNRRGFRSETEYLKQLIKILSKDDNYPFIKKLKMIKERYEIIRNN